MIHHDEPYFIDFQGGRRGPLAYDLASFLFQARANFSEKTREALLQHYLNTLEKFTTVHRPTFTEQLYAFAFFKSLQNLGTYGYRGLFEQKALFTQSIAQTVATLCNLINNNNLKQLSCNYLFEIINNLQLCSTTEAQSDVPENRKLAVTLYSFAYRNGYPRDSSGNNGGFVFDCRSLSNPGRLPELSNLTGRDKEVIDFLANETAVQTFLQLVFATLDISIGNYIERGFTHLAVAFGCTGGQHRSVYCAEQTAKYLVEKHKIAVRLVHREQRIEQLLMPEP